MVYVVQEQANKNILPAKKFGEIKILLPIGTQVTFSPGQIVNKLFVEMSNFNDDDYLLLIGDPVAIGIATTVAAYWNKGRVKMLKWDRQEHIYYPIEIDINHKPSGDIYQEFFKPLQKGESNGKKEES